MNRIECASTMAHSFVVGRKKGREGRICPLLAAHPTPGRLQHNPTKKKKQTHANGIDYWAYFHTFTLL